MALSILTEWVEEGPRSLYLVSFPGDSSNQSILSVIGRRYAEKSQCVEKVAKIIHQGHCSISKISYFSKSSEICLQLLQGKTMNEHAIAKGKI